MAARDVAHFAQCLGAEEDPADIRMVRLYRLAQSPRGLPHFPLACGRLDAPYRLMNVGLAPVYREQAV